MRNIKRRGKKSRIALRNSQQHDFVKIYGARNRKEVEGVSRDAMEVLQSYSWPGNVRELENTIERAIVLSRDPVIQAADLPAGIREGSGVFVGGPAPSGMVDSLPAKEGEAGAGRERELVVPIGTPLAIVVTFTPIGLTTPAM